MANLLYLVHRLPYPPNKGDKVRSYHLLKHLAARHRVFLGTLVDDPEDEPHVERLRQLCAEVHAPRLYTGKARLASLVALATGEALTLRYYRHAGLAGWVDSLMRRVRIDAAVVFSSSMVQYVDRRSNFPVLVDFVDIDSAKWQEYAGRHRWPSSWVYRREGRLLLAYERDAATRATRSFFVTPKEVEMFRRLAPECADRVEPLCNGVDAEYFSPDHDRPSPFSADEWPLVFTGAMDYWPNVDAVVWFAMEILPALRRRWPRVRLHVVGRNPAPAVQALSGEAISVSGTVPDVRPYLQHAHVVVAPLRLARGVQNKVLEAMAMARPVVAAQCCVEAIDMATSQELLAADDPQDYARHIGMLLEMPERARQLGVAARERVLASYSWAANLAGLDRHLTPPIAGIRKVSA